MFIAFFILLATYLFAFFSALRHGFSKAGSNVAVLVSGGLLLLPIATLGTWYSMIYDWPMNVGGKPNWTWYSNEPTVIGGLEIVAYGGIVLMILVLGSLLYATARMLMVRRGRRAA